MWLRWQKQSFGLRRNEIQLEFLFLLSGHHTRGRGERIEKEEQLFAPSENHTDNRRQFYHPTSTMLFSSPPGFAALAENTGHILLRHSLLSSSARTEKPVAVVSIVLERSG